MFDLFAFETITVAGTAVGFTAATLSPGAGEGAETALLTLESGQIRWRADGTAPTATVGHVMDPGDVLTLSGGQTLQLFRAIRTGGVSGSLSVSYGRA